LLLRSTTAGGAYVPRGGRSLNGEVPKAVSSRVCDESSLVVDLDADELLKEYVANLSKDIRRGVLLVNVCKSICRRDLELDLV